MLKAKPFRGKPCSHKAAKKVNDFLNSLPKLNREVLEKDVRAFEEYAKAHNMVCIDK